MNISILNPQTPKLKIHLRTPKGGWVQPPWIFAFPSEFFENISHGYVFGVKESNRDNEKILSSLHDLENLGQTPFLRLKTWYKVDLGVDSNIFEVEDIKYVKKNNVTLTIDFGTQGHTHSLYDLPYLLLYTGYRLDLGVDSNIFKVKDLRKPKISHLTFMVDLENEGQTHLCMTFRISGCKHHTDMIFVSILTISRPGMSKMLK